jgi:hypothetical protein
MYNYEISHSILQATGTFISLLRTLRSTMHDLCEIFQLQECNFDCVYEKTRRVQELQHMKISINMSRLLLLLIVLR